MKIAIVKLEDMSIASIYEDTQPSQIKYGGPWGDYSTHRHVEIPDSITSRHVQAELNDAGDIEITEDMQPARNEKLSILREMRDIKMKEVDIMVNDLAVGDRTDTTAVRDYRTALKDVTDDHKYANDDNRGKASLDAFAADMSDFSWPVKP